VIYFQQQPDVAITAVSDAYAPRRDQAASFIGGGVKTYRASVWPGLRGRRYKASLLFINRHPYVTDNTYQNPFFNEAALMETDGGHMTRCNVFWLVCEDGERAQWYGENGTLYMANSGLYGDLRRERMDKPQALQYPKYVTDPMVPPPMRHHSDHGGSHVFLSAEFINALVDDREPAIDVYQALAMTAPGIVGHQSAMRKGDRLKVPSFDKA